MGVKITIPIIIIFFSFFYIFDIVHQQRKSRSHSDYWNYSINNRSKPYPKFVISGMRIFSNYKIINVYDVFRRLPDVRRELILEGSIDGDSWHEYSYRFRTSNIKRPPIWFAPHQPRIEHQHFYLVNSDIYPYATIWYKRFLRKIFEGDRSIKHVFKYDPFKKNPPKYLRAKIFRYEYTNWQEWQWGKGPWWKREFVKYLFNKDKITLFDL